MYNITNINACRLWVALFLVFAFGIYSCSVFGQTTVLNTVDVFIESGCEIVAGKTLISYRRPLKMIWSFSKNQRAKYNQITQGTAGIFVGSAFYGSWKNNSSSCCWKIDGLGEFDCFQISEIQHEGNLQEMQPAQCWIVDRNQPNKCFKTENLVPIKQIALNFENGISYVALLYGDLIDTGRVIRNPVNIENLKPVDSEQFKEEFGQSSEDIELHIIEKQD